MRSEDGIWAAHSSAPQPVLHLALQVKKWFPMNHRTKPQWYYRILYIYMCVCVLNVEIFICLFIPFHNHPIIIYWNEKHPIELPCLFQAMAPGSSKVHQAERPNLGCPWRESAARPPAVAFPSSDPHHGISRHVFWPSPAFYLAPIRTFFLASVLAFYLWHSISQFVPVLLRATKLAQSASQ